MCKMYGTCTNSCVCKDLCLSIPSHSVPKQVFRLHASSYPQETRLREAAFNDLVEWIPQLVQDGVDINASDVVRM